MSEFGVNAWRTPIISYTVEWRLTAFEDPALARP